MAFGSACTRCRLSGFHGIISLTSANEREELLGSELLDVEVEGVDGGGDLVEVAANCAAQINMDVHVLEARSQRDAVFDHELARDLVIHQSVTIGVVVTKKFSKFQSYTEAATKTMIVSPLRQP